MPTPIPDQAELLAAHDEAVARVTALTGELDTARAQASALTVERDQLKATLAGRDTAIATLTGERDQALTVKADAEKAKAEAEQARTAAEARVVDFEKAVAAEVVKRGVGSTPVPPPKAAAGTPATEPKNDVERVLARHGCTTVEEFKAMQTAAAAAR